MQLQCPECDRRFNLRDEQAGKKARCPDCNHQFKAPRASEGGNGLLIGLIGGGAALVLLLGLGIGYFATRGGGSGASGGTRTDASGDRTPKDARTDYQGSTGEFQVGLADCRAERVSPSGRLRISANYSLTGPLPDDVHLGLFAAFPADPNNPLLVKTIKGQEVRQAPKGTWTSDEFTPAALAAADTQCELVLRAEAEPGKLKDGRVLARILNVAVPAAPTTSVKLDRPLARRAATDAGLVEISFDFKLDGPRPALVLFEVEFVNPNKGPNRRATLGKRTGADIKPAEAFSASVNCPFPKARLCHLHVSDREPGTGNLAQVTSVPIQADAPAVKPSIVLANAKAVRSGKADCKISVNVKAGKGIEDGRSYQCWAAFKVGGVVQPANKVGAPLQGRAVKKGTAVAATLKLPANAVACDLTVRELGVPKPAKVGELANVAIQGSAALPPLRVTLHGVKAQRAGPNTIRVSLSYDFSRPPDARKVYAIVVQRADGKDKNARGHVVMQAPGSGWKTKGQVSQNVSGGNFGKAKRFRVWLADGANKAHKFTTAHTVTVGK